MRQWRKRPVTAEAEIITEDNIEDLAEALGGKVVQWATGHRLELRTPGAGSLFAQVGHFVGRTSDGAYLTSLPYAFWEEWEEVADDGDDTEA